MLCFPVKAQKLLFWINLHVFWLYRCVIYTHQMKACYSKGSEVSEMSTMLLGTWNCIKFYIHTISKFLRFFQRYLWETMHWTNLSFLVGLYLHIWNTVWLNLLCYEERKTCVLEINKTAWPQNVMLFLLNTSWRWLLCSPVSENTFTWKFTKGPRSFKSVQ